MSQEYSLSIQKNVTSKSNSIREIFPQAFIPSLYIT